MTAKEIFDSESFKQCESFHGHVCPGLCLGFKAANAAMAWLRAARAEDEELVAIVETDACSADAVQVLTGCTFGKGNFIFMDHGKMVLTLLSRRTGHGVRVALKAGAFEPDSEHMTLIQAAVRGELSVDAQQRFNTIHTRRSEDILTTPDSDLFTISAVAMPLPAPARIEPSQPCARCGEPTMPSKMVVEGQAAICRGCVSE